MKEEDRVVYLLASLPECYSVLVTALEANPTIPTLAVVTERLLHEESKLKSRSAQSSGNPEGALTSSYRRRLKCNYCHINQDTSSESVLSSQGSRVKLNHLKPERLLR